MKKNIFNVGALCNDNINKKKNLKKIKDQFLIEIFFVSLFINLKKKI